MAAPTNKNTIQKTLLAALADRHHALTEERVHRIFQDFPGGRFTVRGAASIVAKAVRSGHMLVVHLLLARIASSDARRRGPPQGAAIGEALQGMLTPEELGTLDRHIVSWSSDSDGSSEELDEYESSAAHGLAHLHAAPRGWHDPHIAANQLWTMHRGDEAWDEDEDDEEDEPAEMHMYGGRGHRWAH